MDHTKIGNFKELITKLRGITVLEHFGGSPFVVLISTILSQRTRDENTLKASNQLFSKYKTPKELATAPIEEIEKLIRPSGFYRIKSMRIKEVAKIIMKKYNDKVPNNIHDLLQLPGVGRKTANCVLVYGFREKAIPVDIHVHRISNRLGLVKTKTPERTEEELCKIIPEEYWLELNEIFVKFGQQICRPLKPLCSECPISQDCISYS